MKYLYLFAGTLLPAFSYGSENADATLKNSSVMTTQGLLQWILSTFAIVGIILLIAYILKKVRFMPGSVKGISIVSQISVGPKERVVQLRLSDNREILVGVSTHNVNFLCALDQLPEVADKKSSASIKENIETFESIMKQESEGQNIKAKTESVKDDAKH